MVTERTNNRIEVTLYSDAKARTDRFAICGDSGEPLWYGRFFDSDHDYNGEQSTGEMAAAKKAVWLASKIPHADGVEIHLELKVDAKWLTWANNVSAGEKGGGKARALGLYAQKLGVILSVTHIPGSQNPADAYTVCQGFKKYDVAEINVTEYKG